MATKKYNVSGATGTFDTIAAGSAVSGNAVFLGNDVQRVSSLSALLVIDAETSTITIAARWQVSNDNSTWVEVAHNAANGAATVIATGTAGADASVTKVYEAPAAIYGYKFARVQMVVGVTTGAVGDTYTYGYSYIMGD